MVSLQTYHATPRLYYRFSSPRRRARNLSFCWRLPAPFSRKVRVFASLGEGNYQSTERGRSVCCFCNNESRNVQIEKVSVVEEEVKEQENEQPRFDINLAVILAGFAFEAYTTPPENIGRREVDAGDCKTVYLSESFVREIYDGQLFVKLKKGLKLPAMDPWGTSDPYVVMQLDGQIVKSNIKWGKKEPTWNEDFTFNIKQSANKNLQVAAWDANLVAPHKRMGNASINLQDLCDGNFHQVLVDLEGMGSGGKLELEVNYKTFEEIDEEKKWWRLSFVSEFLRRNDFESALKKVVGSESIPARQFVEYAFGQLKSFNDAYISKDRLPTGSTSQTAVNSDNSVASDMHSTIESATEASMNDANFQGEGNSESVPTDASGHLGTGHDKKLVTQASVTMQSDKPFWNNLADVIKEGATKQSDKQYWKNFADVISETVVQKLGHPVNLEVKWDGFDLLNRIGLQSQKIAEAEYVESGLATPDGQDAGSDKASSPPENISVIQSSLPDIKKATEDLLKQTDSVLGALMVLTATVSKLNKEAPFLGKNASESEKLINSLNGPVLDEKKAEEMRALFQTAESAMEAWAMLATSLGHPSFIKSEFEKICFLDNAKTDTQVAIWRDSLRRRLVVAFRGTEQSKWKDLLTDLMLVPAGLNPERLGGDFKQEVQVHSGFLSAYDSVRIRIISVIKQSIGYRDDGAVLPLKWHIYVTGHSLGGALATLLALELSSSQLAKRDAISVTMYNFGSPRVGNKRFAEVYNKNVKDSWRVVNHRDIIPTVPRLMGYCHVAQPVYLAAGELKDALDNLELMKDGYHGDVIGEATPDVLVSEFMKGEKELIEKILQTEINIFRAIRDGSALMQHMEDFYYITLLENVRSSYQIGARLDQDGSSSI